MSRLDARNAAQHRERMLRADPFCVWCQKRLTWRTATIEHLLPRSKGGTHHPRNLALACPECNHKRGNALAAPETP